MSIVLNYEIERLPSLLEILMEEVKSMKELLHEVLNMPIEKNGVIGIDDVSKLTGYSKNTIYQYVHQQTIPFHKPEHGGRKLIFFRTEIEDWLKAENRKPLKNIAKGKNLNCITQ